MPMYLRRNSSAIVNMNMLDSYYANALSLYRDKRLMAAIKALEAVVAFEKIYKDAESRLAYYKDELETVHFNEGFYRKEVEEDPSNQKARFNLAETLYVLGKTDEAVSLWEDLLVEGDARWSKQARKRLDLAYYLDTKYKTVNKELTRSFTSTPKVKPVSYNSSKALPQLAYTLA